MTSPSIPPRPAPVTMPDDPFEAWLARQAIAGHDRQWLRRNRPALAQRWKSGDTSDLPAPPPRDARPVPDRYSEV